MQDQKCPSIKDMHACDHVLMNRTGDIGFENIADPMTRPTPTSLFSSFLLFILPLHLYEYNFISPFLVFNLYQFPEYNF